MTRHVLISPHDTALFRDGRPFNQDDEGMSLAISQFPPSPSSVAMSVRAALAAGEGWRGGNWTQVNWPGKRDDFTQVLGDGPTDLGKLRFHAPVLRKAGVDYYPVPLMVVKDHEKQVCSRLSPGPEIRTDMGRARMPVTVSKNDCRQWKSLDHYYLSGTTLQAVLEGGLPDPIRGIITIEDMVSREARTGIARDEKSRTSDDGQIYAASHIRLKADAGILAGFVSLQKCTIREVPPSGGWQGE